MLNEAANTKCYVCETARPAAAPTTAVAVQPGGGGALSEDDQLKAAMAASLTQQSGPPVPTDLTGAGVGGDDAEIQKGKAVIHHLLLFVQ